MNKDTLRRMRFVIFAAWTTPCERYRVRMELRQSSGRVMYFSGPVEGERRLVTGLTPHCLETMGCNVTCDGEGILDDMLKAIQSSVKNAGVAEEVCVSGQSDRVKQLATALLIDPSEDDLRDVERILSGNTHFMCVENGRLLRLAL